MNELNFTILFLIVLELGHLRNSLTTGNYFNISHLISRLLL